MFNFSLNNNFSSPPALMVLPPSPAFEASNGTVAVLRKLKCTEIKSFHGSVQVDQVDSKLNPLMQDLKGSQEKVLSSLQLLPCYMMFFSKEQKKQILGNLVDIIKREPIELRAYAAEILEDLIDDETEKLLMKQYNFAPHLSALISFAAAHNAARRFAFRCMHKLAKYPHNHESLAANQMISLTITEISRPVSQICSDACVHILSTLVAVPLYASQIVTANGVVHLLNLIRNPTTTPCKLIPPTVETLRKLAAHDTHALRTLITQGATQLISGVAAMKLNLFFPHMHIDAALALCEFASTKDTEAQDLLLRASIGDALIGCLQHPNMEVKRAGIRAIEHWMYHDDRMTLYNMEFILNLIQHGVDLPQRVKDLFTKLKQIIPSSPGSQQIAALVNEIRQRPEATNTELNKLRDENKNLKSNLETERAHIKRLEAIIAGSAPPSPAKAPEPPPSPTSATFDVNTIKTLDELGQLESKLLQRRQILYTQFHDMMTCPVCFDNNKDTSLSPCGHTLCSLCAPKVVQQGKCHVCRGKVDRTSKLFF